MKNIMDSSKLLLNKGLLQVKKHSPEILTGIGIFTGVCASIIACKKTLKINDILEEKNKKIEDIHQCLEDTNIDYGQNDANKDLTLTYIQTGGKLLKLYSPALALGAISISSIISGQHILKKRNVAIAAAYAIINKSFIKYRENVIEAYGQGVDQQMRFNIKAKEIQKKDEKGKEKKEIVEEVNGSNEELEYSDYARFFDASCSQFKKDAEYNLMYLRRQQDYANEMLKARGHLFLNEVYDLLDIPRTKAGQMVGWIYDPKNNKKGDNYVDFGIYKDTEPHRRFVNGMEYNILLDFNVDGPIYNLI